MSNSSASSATITAIVVFENGRGSGLNLTFDAQMYLSDSDTPLLAALRYFNSENHVFGSIGFYFIIARARVAQMESGARIALEDSPAKLQIEESDYDLVGDIVCLIPIADNGVNPAITPYVELCGSVEQTDDLTRTFTLNPHQFVNALRPSITGNSSMKDASGSPTLVFQSILPVECTFPDTPRWKNAKILPAANRYVSVTGFITGRKDVESKPLGNKGITRHFCVTIESIVFLGCPVIARTPSGVQVDSSANLGHSKLKFSFSKGNKRKRLDDSETADNSIYCPCQFNMFIVISCCYHSNK
ncbi:hypothetical protein EDC04DRAFT_3148697, partial [Pisolithus marmoratus]